MKLSEAIRKGSEGMQPISGPTFNLGPDGEVCGVCAIGAAIRGAGGDVRHSMDGWQRLFPPAPEIRELQCPACEGAKFRDCKNIASALVSAVIHLYEDHRWTFEQVADWIQAQEAIHGIGQPESAAQVNRETLTELVTV